MRLFWKFLHSTYFSRKESEEDKEEEEEEEEEKDLYHLYCGPHCIPPLLWAPLYTTFTVGPTVYHLYSGPHCIPPLQWGLRFSNVFSQVF